MADYIYLLQNRLTPAQWRALEAVREAARTHNMPVFLVGGAVRDLTSGSPVRDLDFAVQGEAATLTGDLEQRGAFVAGRSPVSSSVYLTFPGGVRAEVGPTLSITYPQPGQPEVQPATILDDLRRRDFTANAMAVSLNEGSYGLLLDPLNGTADIENRELRLVGAYGFIEQPALLLRAARLGERLGWSLEERTRGRYDTGKEEGYIAALPASDRAYELEEIFHEEDPLTILEHMEAEGWREILFPALRPEDGDRAALDEIRDLVGQLEGQGLHPDPSAVTFPFVTAKLGERERTALKQAFAREGFARQIESIEARSRDLAAQLTSRAAAQPSAVWKLLMEADPEVTLYLAYHSRSAAVQGKLKSFLKEWPQLRQKIPYALMQEMRITPDLPEYERLLDDLFFALMDGKLDTPEAARAFLEPYSPPAPPQVAVRRRPAKASRSRAKRVAEEVADEPAEPLDEDSSAEGSEDADAEGAEEREEEPGNTPAAPSLDAGVPQAPPGARDRPSESDAKPEPVKEPVAGKPSGPVTKARPAKGPAAPTKLGATPPAKTAEKAVAVKSPASLQGAASVKGTAPVRAAASVKAAAAPARTPAAAKSSASLKEVASTKPPAPAQSPAPPKKGAGKAAAAPAPASKSAAKGITTQKAAGNKVKTVNKASSKAVPAKKGRSKPPAKAVKATGKKTAPTPSRGTKVPGKAAAKKQPAQGHKAVPAKRPSPAKAAKKVAAKSQKRR